MDEPMAFNQRGLSLVNEGRAGEAVECFRRALALRPDFPQALNNLGCAMQMLYRFEEAIEHHKAALALGPDNPNALNNLSMACRAIGRKDEAVEAARLAVTLSPGNPLSHNNLAMALQDRSEFDEAESHFKIALQRNPDPSILVNLGSIYFETGRLDESLEAFERAIAAGLTRSEVFSARLHVLHYHPKADLRLICEAHRQWDALFSPQNRVVPARPPLAGRKLRIGFVSADFHGHPVGRFIAPLISNFNREAFEIYCYSDCLIPDAVTRRIESACDHWVPTVALDHSQLAERIAGDSIHILVDLALHATGNRLPAFALKPAPVQVSWLGYCSTTGLSAMDYRISDPHMDPVGRWDALYSERTVRLPKCYWCYEAPEGAPAAGPSPALGGAPFTFGCLNSVCKINDAVVDAWSEAMKGVSGSRLIVHAFEGSARRLLIERFERRGVEGSRIEFAGNLPMKEYLALYGRIDLALDPFPYNGGTTTCDALWMGVPVVSLAGDRPMGRAGVSLLTNLGLDSWIAKDEREYVKMATEASGRLEELSALRETLRERMRKSPLMDSSGFARDFEALLKSLWEDKY